MHIEKISPSDIKKNSIHLANFTNFIMIITFLLVPGEIENAQAQEQYGQDIFISFRAICQYHQ